MEPLKEFASQGKPMFGTCAGLILLARELVGLSRTTSWMFDVTVERNSFGRQVESFEAELDIKDWMNHLLVCLFVPLIL